MKKILAILLGLAGLFLAFQNFDSVENTQSSIDAAKENAPSIDARVSDKVKTSRPKR